MLISFFLFLLHSEAALETMADVYKLLNMMHGLQLLLYCSHFVCHGRVSLHDSHYILQVVEELIV